MFFNFKIFIFFALISIFSGSVFAQTAPQPDKIDIETLRPALGRGPFMYISGLEIPAHMEYGAQMLFNMGFDLLLFTM